MSLFLANDSATGSLGPASAGAAGASASNHQLHLLQRFFVREGTPGGAVAVEIKPSSSVEWCLDATFGRFVALADSKLEVVLHQSTDREIDLHRYLQAGVDAEFDACLATFGSLAKHAPSLAINTLMAWRDVAGDLPETVPQTPVYFSSIRGSMRGSVKSAEPARDIRLITSNILFCRALIEVIPNVSPAAMKDDIGQKCEELAFNQLRLSIPDLIRNSTNWLANATYFARVLGELSAVRFTSVSDRYLRELEKLTSVAMMKEGKAEHIIYGMRFIRIKLYPMDALDDTADFLDSLGHFFLNSVDASIRQAFIETFLELLGPLCETITAEVNVPTWVAFVESIFPKVQKMALRPRHQSAAFALLAALLSVSRSDFFHKHWMTVVDMCQSKFKDRDRGMRSDALLCLTQLLWVYLFRYSEPAATAQKRLAMLVKLLFPQGRRSIHPPEVSVDLFTYIVYMAGIRFSAWTVTNIIAPLVACEGSGSPESAWSPDRMSIGIVALNWLLSAWNAGEQRCAFPELPIPGRAKLGGGSGDAVKAKYQPFLSQLSGSLHRIFDTLHQLVGGFQLDDERNRSVAPFKGSNSTTSLYSDLLGGATGGRPDADASNLDLASAAAPVSFVAPLPPVRIPFLELLKTLVSATPRLMPLYERERLVDVLSSYAVHFDRGLCDVAMAALDRMVDAASDVYQDVLLSLEGRVMAVADRQFDLLTAFYVRPDETSPEQAHRGVLEIYADFFSRGRAYTRQLPLDALGLYHMCSPSVQVRRLAVQILKDANSTVVGLLEETKLAAAVVSGTKAGADEWAAQFGEFMLYCVDFLSRDSIKKAVQIALERTNFLHAVLAPSESGILWTTAARSPPEESILHWKRCSTLVVLGIKYLANPREVLGTFLSLLGSEFTSVREAALSTLAFTSVTHQSLLLDEAMPMLQSVADDARLRVGKRYTVPKKPSKLDRLRIEVPRLLTTFESFPPSTQAPIVNMIRAYKQWLADQPNNPDVDPVKTAFAQFVTSLFSKLAADQQQTAASSKYMELRGQLYQLLSEWDDPVSWEAMAALLRGPVPSKASSSSDPFDRDRVLRWINSLLTNPTFAAIGFRGLVNMLLGNPASKPLHEMIVRACFVLPSSDAIGGHYLCAFSTVFRNSVQVQHWTATTLETVMILGLLKLGDDGPNKGAVARAALDMLQFLQDRVFLDLDVASLAKAIEQPIHRQSANAHIVERMARNHPEWTYSLLSELFLRIQMSDPRNQAELFAFASLLMRNVVLVSDASFISSESRFVVDNLMYLTVTQSDNHAGMIRKCWTTLVADSPDNLKAVVAYFVQLAKTTRSDVAVAFIQVVLSFIHDVESTFECLLPYLTPATFIYFPPEPEPAPAPTAKFFVPNLDTVIPPQLDHQQWSEGVVGALVLAGLVGHLPPTLVEQYLALFLEVAIAQLAHPDAYVSAQMKAFLCAVFKFEFTFESFDAFLAEVVDALPASLVDAWNLIALRWASNCTILHVAIKSLEMFRCSLRDARDEMLQDLLRLFLAAGVTQVQFVSEILLSIHAVLSHPSFAGHPDSLTQTLQIVLQALARATPDHVDLLLRILEVLLVIPTRIHTIDLGFLAPYPAVSALLLDVFQTHGNERARTLMNRLISVEETELPAKPVLVLLANLPRLVAAPFTDEIDAVCLHLATMVAESCRPLAKYLAAWTKYRAKSPDDLMLQLAQAMRDPYLAHPATLLRAAFRFLASTDHATVHAHLLFLKHALPSVRLAEGDLNADNLTAILDLTRHADVAPLALAVSDTLLSLLPTVAAEPNAAQAVLPSRSCTINKKNSKAANGLMQEWARQQQQQQGLRHPNGGGGDTIQRVSQKLSSLASASSSRNNWSGDTLEQDAAATAARSAVNTHVLGTMSSSTTMATVDSVGARSSHSAAPSSSTRIPLTGSPTPVHPAGSVDSGSTAADKEDFPALSLPFPPRTSSPLSRGSSTGAASSHSVAALVSRGASAEARTIPSHSASASMVSQSQEALAGHEPNAVSRSRSTSTSVAGSRTALGGAGTATDSTSALHTVTSSTSSFGFVSVPSNSTAAAAAAAAAGQPHQVVVNHSLVQPGALVVGSSRIALTPHKPAAVTMSSIADDDEEEASDSDDSLAGVGGGSSRAPSTSRRVPAAVAADSDSDSDDSLRSDTARDASTVAGGSSAPQSVLAAAGGADSEYDSNASSPASIIHTTTGGAGTLQHTSPAITTLAGTSLITAGSMDSEVLHGSTSIPSSSLSGSEDAIPVSTMILADSEADLGPGTAVLASPTMQAGSFSSSLASDHAASMSMLSLRSVHAEGEGSSEDELQGYTPQEPQMLDLPGSPAAAVVVAAQVPLPMSPREQPQEIHEENPE
ncbi:Cell morphogenesis protein PAG1 [Blastocladiella emersonii ATCC 22665]|nr:Cell morphogenesis protein PAG1 [Blastocladiella emersonii ATCC 22665]